MIEISLSCDGFSRYFDCVEAKEPALYTNRSGTPSDSQNCPEWHLVSLAPQFGLEYVNVVGSRDTGLGRLSRRVRHGFIWTVSALTFAVG